MKRLQHPTEPPPARASWRAGEPITFGGLSDKSTGYMGYTERVGPSVLVLHEAYGLTDSVRAYVDRLAEEGFTALAPDLYEGRIGTTLEEAQALAHELPLEAAMRTIKAAATHMSENWHPRLGVIGFSMGAGLATSSRNEIERDATVAYYGYSPAALSPNAWAGPLIAHLAEVDEFKPLDAAQRTFGALAESGHDVEFFVYEGTNHSFANSDVPDAYNEAAAEQAWERTLESLYYYLS
ncbi:MAG: dienelactone hydrolase family protein [Actinomycetota bacterium]